MLLADVPWGPLSFGRSYQDAFVPTPTGHMLELTWWNRGREPPYYSIFIRREPGEVIYTFDALDAVAFQCILHKLTTEGFNPGGNQ